MIDVEVCDATERDDELQELEVVVGAAVLELQSALLVLDKIDRGDAWQQLLGRARQHDHGLQSGRNGENADTFDKVGELADRRPKIRQRTSLRGWVLCTASVAVYKEVQEVSSLTFGVSYLALIADSVAVVSAPDSIEDQQVAYHPTLREA